MADNVTTGLDEYGDTVVERPVIAELYAAKMGAKSRQFIAAKSIYDQADAVFKTRFHSGITPRQFLRDTETGEEWEIIGVDGSRRFDELQIVAKALR